LVGTPAGRIVHSSTMKKHLVAACAALAPVLSSAAENAAPQRGAPPSNSLSRVLGVFSVSDADHDGKISAEEARAIPVTPEDLKKEDVDGDGAWSREEFTLYYRARLVAGGQSVGSDLDAEVARIQALKRVRVVEEARKSGAEATGTRSEAEPPHVRLERALADLERNAADRKTKPEDFRRLRNLVILSGRSAPASSQSTSGTKMIQALDRIEKRVASGQPVREDFDSIRTLLAPPADLHRPAANELGARRAPGATPTSGADPIQGPAASRQRASEPRGSSRPGTKPPTPKPVEKPTPPPEAERRSKP
jgi:hypothetical protein